MREYLRVMKAAADGTRVKILKMLQQRKLCVCEMQAVLGISQPSVSRHLRLLEDAIWCAVQRTACGITSVSLGQRRRTHMPQQSWPISRSGWKMMPLCRNS